METVPLTPEKGNQSKDFAGKRRQDYHKSNYWQITSNSKQMIHILF